MFLLNCFDFKVPRRGQQIYHLIAAEQDMNTSRGDSVQEDSITTPTVDVSGTLREINLQLAQQTVRPKISPEV